MKQLFSLSFFFMFSAGLLNAQTYSLITTTETYSNIANPVSLNNGQVWEMPDYIIPSILIQQLILYIFLIMHRPCYRPPMNQAGFIN